MKSFIVFALFVAAAVAAPPRDSDKDAVVLRNDNDNIGVDGYNTAYETSNGIQGQEQGQLEQVGTEDEAMEVRGRYSYIGDDGITYEVVYTAGREGFKPIGAHIPQA